MGHFGWVDTLVLVIYFLSMAALGPLLAHRSKTTEGYFVGDRNMPGWLVGISMFATSISSITFMAYPADAYKTAWYRMIPNYSLPIAIFIAAYFFLPFFRRGQITSAYEYLEERFGPYTRIYAAVAFTIAQITRISMILYLVALLVHEITGLDKYASILVGGVVTSFYTVLGGITAVVWTDFIQAFVLWLGAGVSLYYLIAHIPGGLGEIFSLGMAHHKFSLYDLDPVTKTLEPVQWSPDLTRATVTLFFLVGLGNWLAEYSSNQNVVQRYVATRSMRETRQAMWICCLTSIPTWALFMFLGTSLYVFFQHFPTPEAMNMLTGEGGAKADQIFPYFIRMYLPQGLTGLVIAGVLAAAMSSLSSSINSVSAVTLTDIYKRHMKPHADDDHYVRVAKGISIALSVIMLAGATWLMASESKTLLDTSTIVTALTAGGLFGLYALGFFTLRGDDRTVLPAIALTVAFTAWVTLSSLKVLPEGMRAPIFNYYTGIIGHALTFCVGYLLSLWIPPRRRDLTNLTVWTQRKEQNET